MSRRKDRERYESLKRFRPDYMGFRGYNIETPNSGLTMLDSLVCATCGRKRNVSPDLTEDQRKEYVCQSCQDAEEG